MVTVVKVNQPHDNFTDYIGREWAGFPTASLHNPFHIGKDGDREAVILKFAEYWYAPEQKTLRRNARLALDEDAVLGCWCAPLLCHGDIIAGYLNWKNQDRGLFE